MIVLLGFIARIGWQNERFTGFILSPVKDSLVGEVLAWTPGTDGTVTAEAVQIVPPRCSPAPGARPGETQRCPDEAGHDPSLECGR